MNLPDEQLLEDSRWQLDYAGDLVAPLFAAIQARPEPADPAQRPAYEQEQSLLRALQFYFQAATKRLDLLEQTFDEMDAEMNAANSRYRSMRLAHDFALHEAQVANARYYKETDIFTALYHRLKLTNRA